MADEEPKPTAKSAEDRKAASALASLDAVDSSTSHNVDQEAVNKAIKALSGAPPPSTTKKTTTAAATPASKKPSHKNVKVDAADVALLVDQLDLPKPRATELLKSYEGDAVKAMRAWVHNA